MKIYKKSCRHHENNGFFFKKRIFFHWVSFAHEWDFSIIEPQVTYLFVIGTKDEKKTEQKYNPNDEKRHCSK